MRITTWNVNGLRSALAKGFQKHIRKIRPDVLLLQEIRVHPLQLPGKWARPRGWHVHWHPAEKKGYSGTAIWSRHPIEDIRTGLEGSDPEGRVIRAMIQGVRVICVYLPSGSSGDHRQQVKEAWMDRFMPWTERLLGSADPVVMGGDLNIAHTEKDIFYAKSNEDTSGFLPHERAWMGRLLAMGWRDLVRRHYGDVQGPYTWWSNRGRAREAGLDTSDHAPVTIDIE